MRPGGVQKRLSASTSAALLRRIAPATAVEAERQRIATELVGDIRRLDTAIAAVKTRIVAAVAASGSSVTEVYGVGPIVAALILGHAGDITRFATADQFASYNGTAPIEASSGPKVRHRLNPRGNRQLNHALHMAALSQISHPCAGRDYYDKKVAEGKSTKEAKRALKRRISDAVYRQLRADQTR
jgi:transposase